MREWTRGRWAVVAAFAVVFALALGVSGCGSRSQPRPTPTATATFTPAVPTPTNTATATRTPTATPRPSPTPTPDPNVNPLTGLSVADPSSLERPPILARIGNDAPIRPQAGLGAAEIVYEDIMDGWSVTRLTAIFLSEDPEVVGPIRSARLVSIELANQYQGALVHSGASDQVRWFISQEPFTNLDEFYHPRPFYYVDGLGWMGRLHTSAPAVREYLEANGWNEPVSLRGFPFAEEPPKGEPAESIYIPYPGSAAVTFEFDKASETYLRWVSGVPHTDRISGEQLAVSNVIVQFVEHQATDIVEDSNGATSIRMVMQGRGEAWILRDGVAIRGFWERAAKDEMTRFVDEDGAEIPLKPGHTWVELAPPGYEIELSGGTD